MHPHTPALMQRIHDPNGQRLYLTTSERSKFLKAAEQLPARQFAFCKTLALTGCRISEALNLTSDRIDREQKAIVIESLKKRRTGHFRSIPVPQDYLLMMCEFK